MKSVPVYDTQTETTKFVDSRALSVIVNKKYVKSEYKEYFLNREDWISFTKLQRRVSQLGGAKPIKNILDIPKDKYVSETNKKTKIDGVGNVEESVMKKMRTAFPAFGTMPTPSPSSGLIFGNSPTIPFNFGVSFGNTPTTPSNSCFSFGNNPTTQSSSTFGNPTTQSSSTFANPPTTKTTTPPSSCVTSGNPPTIPSSSSVPMVNSQTIPTKTTTSTTTPSSSGFTFGNTTKTTNPTIHITPADLGYNYRVSYFDDKY
jgi:hypothetical protein